MLLQACDGEVAIETGDGGGNAAQVLSALAFWYLTVQILTLCGASQMDVEELMISALSLVEVQTEAEAEAGAISDATARTTPDAALPSIGTLETDDCIYHTGILWLTRNNKMICSGFAPGSCGKAFGVKSGDILKAVDGTSVLQMKVDRKTGKHGVVDLLLGKQASICNLVLLRVGKGVRNVIHGKATADEVRLSEISVSVPREHLL